MVVKAIGISIPEELLEKIEASRGDVTRSLFTVRLIEAGFREREREKEEKNKQSQ